MMPLLGIIGRVIANKCAYIAIGMSVPPMIKCLPVGNAAA